MKLPLFHSSSQGKLRSNNQKWETASGFWCPASAARIPKRKILDLSWPPGCVFTLPASCRRACLWVVRHWWLLQLQNHSPSRASHPCSVWVCRRLQFAWAPRVTQQVWLCHLNLHSLAEEQRLSNEWQLPPGTERGCWPLATGPATLLAWDLLTGLWGNSSYMWTIFYVHQRENRIIWLQMHRNSQMSESSQSSVPPSILLTLSCSISDIQFPIT